MSAAATATAKPLTRKDRHAKSVALSTAIQSEQTHIAELEGQQRKVANEIAVLNRAAKSAAEKMYPGFAPK